MQLRDRVMLYQRLKHSVQLPDSTGFLAEITRFQQGLAAGITAVRARQKGEPHDEAAFQSLLRSPPNATTSWTSTATCSPSRLTLSEPSPTAWRTAGHALLETFETQRLNPNVMAYAALGSAWRGREAGQFNEIVRLFRGQLGQRFGPQLAKGDVETRFNAAEPFYRGMQLYALAFLLALLSWLRWPALLGRSAFSLAFCWLSSRLPSASPAACSSKAAHPSPISIPPRSSSAGVQSGCADPRANLSQRHRLRRRRRDRLRHPPHRPPPLTQWRHPGDDARGARHQPLARDPRRRRDHRLRRSFLAGFLALIYVCRGVLTRSLDRDAADALARMVYGIVCFATLCSLIGTVLGGI